MRYSSIVLVLSKSHFMLIASDNRMQKIAKSRSDCVCRIMFLKWQSFVSLSLSWKIVIIKKEGNRLNLALPLA